MGVREAGLAGLVAALCAGWAHGGDYFIYRPAPASTEQIRAKKADEVAVREITVEKGDTLFGLARRYSGRGINYPQILLFNDIGNPDLIHVGQKIRVPLVGPDGDLAPAPASPAPPPAASTAPTEKPADTTPPTQAKTSTQHAPAHHAEPRDPAAALFAKGVSAYKGGSCRDAVTHFDRFLAQHPDSPLAADASLYRADCLLHLSER